MGQVRLVCLTTVLFLFGMGALSSSALGGPQQSAKPQDGKHKGSAKAEPAKLKVKTHEGKEKVYNTAISKDAVALLEVLSNGEVEALELEKPIEPLKPIYDLALWSIVVFILLLFVLRKMAWGPMLEGLKKREESILSAVEEAKRAREETQRVSAEFKGKMDQAYAEIPKIMEEARREAEAFKEETRAQTAREMQAERQRLRREIDTAKDQALKELWTQAAQLATLISAKVIGKSLPVEEHHRLIDEALVELREAAPRRAGV